MGKLRCRHSCLSDPVRPKKCCHALNVDGGVQRLHPVAYLYCMKVDVALIDRLSNLAKLRFEQDEKEDLAGKLESIIGFVDKLQEVPVQGIEPLIHMGDAVNVWRDDAITYGDHQRGGVEECTFG